MIMTTEIKSNSSYKLAQKKVRALRSFYLHLIFYLMVLAITVIFTPFSNRLVDENVYVWLVSTVFVTWVIALLIQGWCVLGGRILFKKSWEDRKIEEFMKEEEQTWE